MVIPRLTEDTLQNGGNEWSHDPHKKKKNVLSQNSKVHTFKNVQEIIHLLCIM